MNCSSQEVEKIKINKSRIVKKSPRTLITGVCVHDFKISIKIFVPKLIIFYNKFLHLILSLSYHLMDLHKNLIFFTFLYYKVVWGNWVPSVQNYFVKIMETKM